MQRETRRGVGAQWASVHPGHRLIEFYGVWTFLPPPEREFTAAPGHGGCIAEPKMGAPAVRGCPPAGGHVKCRLTVGDRAGHAEDWGSPSRGRRGSKGPGR